MKKYPKILIASNNQGKIKEIGALLSEIGIEAIAPKDLPEFQNFQEPEEIGANFAQNSLIKSRFYAKKAGIPALADDSGFCVVDFDNNPGLHSARFALNEKGEKDFDGAFNKIFQALSDKKIDFKKQKSACFFVCNLCFFDPKDDFSINFEGRVDGFLSEPKGKNGFGYDPIFVKNGMNQTFGEITPDLKEKISHRGLAFVQFLEWLKKN